MVKTILVVIKSIWYIAIHLVLPSKCDIWPAKQPSIYFQKSSSTIGGLEVDFSTLLPYLVSFRITFFFNCHTFLLVDCNITTWTEWTACCNKEKRRTRTAVRGDQCKAVSEAEQCTGGDHCPGQKSQLYQVSFVPQLIVRWQSGQHGQGVFWHEWTHCVKVAKRFLPTGFNFNLLYCTLIFRISWHCFISFLFKLMNGCWEERAVYLHLYSVASITHVCIYPDIHIQDQNCYWRH